MNDDGGSGARQGKEHQENYPREQSPGGAEDEEARSWADEGRESEETSVDIPSQVAREAKLEGPGISMDRCCTWLRTHLYHREDDGEA